ncbi:hypothetical protein [Paenibacillus sp. GP183]|uniref:hypothetical protein n=1 Tax=Paenibacillus sp. GP183 TaxID=1882751 RepID=UPI000B88DCC5|nr:hypothetical protein [Paenibacillus sp. GP183]
MKKESNKQKGIDLLPILFEFMKWGIERFDTGQGRLMKEWLTLEPTSLKEWLFLAEEAIEFVTSKVM